MKRIAMELPRRATPPALVIAGLLCVALLGQAQASQHQLLVGSKGPSPAPSASPAPSSSVTASIMPITPMIMPGCPKDGVLNSLNPLEFPGRAWQLMTLEQQALHPINLVFMNLAGIPSTERAGQITPCLESWGIKKSSVKRIKKDYRVLTFPAMSTEVLVMRTSRDVFVVFRATDDDWVADFNCMYTDDLKKAFNAPFTSRSLKLHKGFWAAYKVVDDQLTAEINKALVLVKATNPFATPMVWFVGHSLGGALASIAALKLTMDSLFLGKIGGVVTFGSPRVGNEAWQTLYNSKLMDITLRFANFRDFVSALPGKNQVCVSTSQLTYSFRHVGRAVQLCPTSNGMEHFVFHPKGTEGSCTPGEFPSIATHLLGHYFDGWRRAFANKFGFPAGLMLSTGLHVRSVMCNQCAIAVKPYPLPTNKAARNDGVVTCINQVSCQDKLVFGLVSWSGILPTSYYRPHAICDTAATFTCQIPIPLDGITNAVTETVSTLSANNVTWQDLAGLAAAVVSDNLLGNSTSVFAQLLGGLAASNSSSAAAANASTTAVTAAALGPLPTPAANTATVAGSKPSNKTTSSAARLAAGTHTNKTMPPVAVAAIQSNLSTAVPNVKLPKTLQDKHSSSTATGSAAKVPVPAAKPDSQSSAAAAAAAAAIKPVYMHQAAAGAVYNLTEKNRE